MTKPWMARALIVVLAGLGTVPVSLRATEARAPHVQVMGATSLTALLMVLARRYHALHPNVLVHVSAGGSAAGLWRAWHHTMDLGAADLPPAAVGVPPGLQQLPLGRIPIVFIAYRGGTPPSVSWAALTGLLDGRIQRWPGKEPGQVGEKVVVVTRSEGSGARWSVERRVLDGQPFSPRAIVQLSNGAVYRTVAATPGALGYVDAAFAGPAVRVLCLDRTCFDRSQGAHWPVAAEAALYWRPPVEPAARAFAAWAARQPDLAEFGILPTGTKGGGPSDGRGQGTTP